jgi:anthranilate phosphoribosyltransferase
MLGRAELAAGDGEAARASFEAVLERQRSPSHPWLATQARFGLARAMLASDREAALSLARRAIEEADAGDAQSRTAVRQIQAWLREHG